MSVLFVVTELFLQFPVVFFPLEPPLFPIPFTVDFCLLILKVLPKLYTLLKYTSVLSSLRFFSMVFVLFLLLISNVPYAGLSLGV